jgi:hypothetical protein
MWLMIALICILCIQLFNRPHLDEPSFKIIKQMEKDSLHPDSIKQFRDMSMSLVKYQRDSIYKGLDRTLEATQLTEQIQNRFPAYDLTYQQVYLKQIKEPKQFINKDIKILDLQGLRLPWFY